MDEYGKRIWRQFCHRPIGLAALALLFLFVLAGIYAPFLASSKPIMVEYEGQWYFPLFRYLFYSGFYTKRIDIFFNLLMFTLPLILIFRNRKVLWGVAALQLVLFAYFAFRQPHDPAADPELSRARQEAVQSGLFLDWDQNLAFMTPYEKLNLLVQYRLQKEQHERISQYLDGRKDLPTLWNVAEENQIRNRKRQQAIMEQNIAAGTTGSDAYRRAAAKYRYLRDRQQWLIAQNEQIGWMVMPLVRSFHWEDDAGGEQSLNQDLPWWELSRINRKDLVAALIFGIRISLVVGLLAVGIALAIGVPIGALAGFYGGTLDIIVSRMLEIWESMPTFFMLLFVVAMLQTKSIFLVVTVIGFFGWTGFSRYIRGEFFKQRNLPYVEACRSLGFRDRYIIFQHILPNAIPPLLTLLPFSIMGAITAEAGLSFLGLGEEGSSSWGVLMDEGRTAFPGESYLLWPPAILLTSLLVSIALVGDALRDALDPKMHR